MDLSFSTGGIFGIAADCLLLIIGLVLIIKGGDIFVDASVAVARALRVPEIVIGATVVSIGTTLPEIITSATSVIKGMAANDAALTAGYNSLAVGNAVGSMMCNAGLILGIVILARPPRAGKGFAVKGLFLIAVTAVLSVFSFTEGSISMWEGIALLALFVVFTGINIYDASASSRVEATGTKFSGVVAEVLPKEKIKAKDVAFFALGAAAIALGATLLVDNAQSLCLEAGIPQQLVGITVVAIGTSLPELATALTSLNKGASDIGLGNIIGANVINATLLLGLVACITGSALPIDNVTKNVAVWVSLAITAILVLPSVFTGKTYRLQGFAMLALYLGFIVYNAVIIVI